MRIFSSFFLSLSFYLYAFVCLSAIIPINIFCIVSVGKSSVQIRFMYWITTADDELRMCSFLCVFD